MIEVNLKVVEGPASGKNFVFDRADCFTLGRAQDLCMSLPDDGYLSRHHFMLEIGPEGCSLTDLESKNGTVVNGKRYGGRDVPGGPPAAEGKALSVKIKNGDSIRAGKTLISVGIKNDEPKTLTLPPPVVAETAKQERPASKKPFEIPGYEIEAELGRGGMGIVFRAREVASGRKVAIKTLLPQAEASEYAMASFEREISLTARLQHKNIVRFLGQGSINGVLYFVLEYVEGMDLSTYVRSKGGKLPAPEALELIVGTLEGLACAHAMRFPVESGGKADPALTVKFTHGIVHRDIKPANILLDLTGNQVTPRLSDFGLAKGVVDAGMSGMTADGAAAGTPLYWPREQITHYKHLAPASDVFSMAAVLYHIVSDTPIRPGLKKTIEDNKRNKRPTTMAQYVNAILRESVPSIRSVCPEIAPPVAAVIDRALKENESPTDPERMREHLAELRYPDAGAFLRALKSSIK